MANTKALFLAKVDPTEELPYETRKEIEMLKYFYKVLLLLLMIIHVNVKQYPKPYILWQWGHRAKWAVFRNYNETKTKQ